MSSFETYLAGKGLSKATVKGYSFYMLDFLAWLDGQNTDADNATAGDIMAYLNYLKQRSLTNISRRNHLIAVRHYMAWRVSVEARQDNPAQHIKLHGIKSRKLYPLLTVQELESIYHNYAVPPEVPESKWVTGKRLNFYKVSRLTRQRNKVILGLMVWQGLTTPEVSNLTLADLKLREGVVYIAGSRSSNERTLELRPAQVMELMEYQLQTRQQLLQYLKGTTDKLFLPSPASGQAQIKNLDTVNVWKRLKEDLKEQSPKFINFLQVRSSVITHWLKAHNLRQVQYMAGHRYVSSTEAYQASNIEELQEDISKYHPMG